MMLCVRFFILLTLAWLQVNVMHGMDTTFKPFDLSDLIDSVETCDAKNILTHSASQQNNIPTLQRRPITDHVGDILILSPIIQNKDHPFHIHAYKCVQTLLNASRFSKQDEIAPIQKLIIKTIETHDTTLMNLLFSAKSPLLNHPFCRFLDQDQNTALHLCIKHDFPEGITSICAHSELKYLDDTNLAGDTPLVYAIKIARPKCVETLINNHCILGDQKVVLDLATTRCPAIVPFLENAQRPVITELPHELLKKIWGYSAVGREIASRINSINFSCISKQFRNCKLFIYPKDIDPDIPLIDLALLSLDCNGIKKVLWKILETPWHTLDESQKQTVKHIITLHKSEELMNTGLDRGPMLGEGPTLLEYALVGDRDHIIDIPFVQFLVENGAQINKKSINPPGYESYKNITPLEYVILHLTKEKKENSPRLWHNVLVCTQYFLQQGGAVNEFIGIRSGSVFEKKLPSYAKNSPKPILFQAIIQGCSDIALKIILSQKNINKNIVANYNGQSHTPLTIAVHERRKKNHGTDYYFSTISLLCNTPGIDINQKTPDNRTVFTVVEQADPHTLNHEKKRRVVSLLKSDRQILEQQPIDTIIQNALDAYYKPAPEPNTIHPIPAEIQAVGAVPVPAPVPGDNAPTISTHYFGKKPLAWFAGFSICAVTAYGLCKYFCSAEQDKNENDGEQDDEAPEHGV